MVKLFKNKICILHGHPKKSGSKTDKPPGSVIKCYSFQEYGKDNAIKKAYAMHSAIVNSQERNA